MKLHSLNLRKVDDCIKCENFLHHTLATCCGNLVTFHQPVTFAELNTINWVCENFDILIINLVEE